MYHLNLRMKAIEARMGTAIIVAQVGRVSSFHGRQASAPTDVAEGGN